MAILNTNWKPISPILLVKTFRKVAFPKTSNATTQPVKAINDMTEEKQKQEETLYSIVAIDKETGEKFGISFSEHDSDFLTTVKAASQSGSHDYVKKLIEDFQKERVNLYHNGRKVDVSKYSFHIKKQNEDKHMPTAYIRWGSSIDRQDPVGYSFNTEAELNAFLLGVDEASDWMDYEQLDEREDIPFLSQWTYKAKHFTVVDILNEKVLLEEENTRRRIKVSIEKFLQDATKIKNCEE